MSFLNKNKEKIMVIVIAIVLIVIIGVTNKERDSITRVEKITGNILTPVNRTVNTISKNIYDFFDGLKNAGELRDDNLALREELILLEEENMKLNNIIGRTDFLRKEAKLVENTNFNLIEAKVVGKEAGNWFDRFTIDKGSKDGIKNGDTVIQAVEVDGEIINEGLIGRVVDVGDNWAKIVTIIDESSKISFKVIRTQDGGVVSGSVNRNISGYLYDNKSDLIKGDKIITSGLGGSYIENIYIGEVEEITSDNEDLMKEILVKPGIDFKKLYKVYVISGKNGDNK